MRVLQILLRTLSSLTAQHYDNKKRDRQECETLEVRKSFRF